MAYNANLGWIPDTLDLSKIDWTDPANPSYRDFIEGTGGINNQVRPEWINGQQYLRYEGSPVDNTGPAGNAFGYQSQYFDPTTGQPVATPAGQQDWRPAERSGSYLSENAGTIIPALLAAGAGAGLMSSMGGAGGLFGGGDSAGTIFGGEAGDLLGTGAADLTSFDAGIAGFGTGGSTGIAPGIAPGVDLIGSDWATGAPTGPTGGMLPTTSTGLTAANTAAGVPAGTPGAGIGPQTVVPAAASSLIPGVSDRLLATGAGALAAGLDAAGQPDSETVTQQRTIDPRIDAALMGANGQPGYLQNLMTMAQQPPPAGVTAAGTAAGNYLSNNYAGNLGTMQNAATGQMNSNIAAPTMQAANAGQAVQSTGAAPFTAGQSQAAAPFTAGQAAGAAPYTAAQAQGVNLPAFQAAQASMLGGVPTVQGAQINFGALPMASGGASAAGASAQGFTPGASQMTAAQLNDPRQQGTNLAPGFQDYLYGDQAQNAYLTGALQRGADQARYNFGNLLDDQNTAFNEQVMGGIRGGAIQAGGIGGSRQGIAEGIAARELAKQQNRAATQYGQDLNSTILGAQSANFQQGRQLGAGLLGTLSGQQYGQEQQRAGLQNTAGQTNAQLGTQASIAGAGNQTGASIASANNATQAGVANAGNATQASVANLNAMAGLLGQQAGLTQSANIANAGYQMTGGIANQNAANAANLANMQAGNQYNLTGGQMALQNNQFNTGQTNTAGLQNQTLGQQANQFNTGQYNTVGMNNQQLGQQNNQFNTGQYNQVGLANNNLLQNNQQFNAGATNNMNQYNAGLLNTANSNNLSANVNTNALNQSTINSGIQNMGAINTGAYNLATNAQQQPFNQFTQALQAYQPYAGMYSGQQTTQPLYNNPWAAAAGGALAGAQLYNTFTRP